ncbi:unnamed protein product [Blepharisma stoltei]|uniref:Uncharacterized protein n=1 Tax=Blepharisma stoltei TaxID=1481888 RepID=A0AAU9ISI8_9CILI|nr:unnamed protein product [Blepharisma stoltei]
MRKCHFTVINYRIQCLEDDNKKYLYWGSIYKKISYGCYKIKKLGDLMSNLLFEHLNDTNLTMIKNFLDIKLSS